VAIKSRVFHFSVDLSDIERNVYETFKISVALHPSESLEFMTVRVLAYALEYADGIAFSPGIGSPDEPTLYIKNLTGSYNAWIEIGAPAPDRVHRASKASPRVAIYCHRSPELTLEKLRQTEIFRGEEISVFSFCDGFIDQLSSVLDRRNELTVSRSEQTVYVGLNGRSFSSAIFDHKVLPSNY
jgi:uncharacterized protein YaeQ